MNDYTGNKGKALLRKHHVTALTLTEVSDYAGAIHESGLYAPIQKSIDRGVNGISIFGTSSADHSLSVILIRDGKGGGDLLVNRIFGKIHNRQAYLKEFHNLAISFFRDVGHTPSFVGDTTQPHG